MNREDGRCSFCGQSLDPSSSTCPSCRRDILDPQIDELVSYKIQPRPLSIALTPRNLAIGGAALLLMVVMPLIAFLSLSRSSSNRPTEKTVITHNQSPASTSTSSTVLC